MTGAMKVAEDLPSRTRATGRHALILYVSDTDEGAAGMMTTSIAQLREAGFEVVTRSPSTYLAAVLSDRKPDALVFEASRQGRSSDERMTLLANRWKRTPLAKSTPALLIADTADHPFEAGPHDIFLPRNMAQHAIARQVDLLVRLSALDRSMGLLSGGLPAIVDRSSGQTEPPFVLVVGGGTLFGEVQTAIGSVARVFGAPTSSIALDFIAARHFLAVIVDPQNDDGGMSFLVDQIQRNPDLADCTTIAISEPRDDDNDDALLSVDSWIPEETLSSLPALIEGLSQTHGSLNARLEQRQAVEASGVLTDDLPARGSAVSHQKLEQILERAIDRRDVDGEMSVLLGLAPHISGLIADMPRHDGTETTSDMATFRDNLLATVLDLVKLLVRREDIVLAGPDHSIWMFLINANTADAEAVAARLRAIVRRTPIGVSSANADGSEPEPAVLDLVHHTYQLNVAASASQVMGEMRDALTCGNDSLVWGDASGDALSQDDGSLTSKGRP